MAFELKHITSDLCVMTGTSFQLAEHYCLKTCGCYEGEVISKDNYVGNERVLHPISHALNVVQEDFEWQRGEGATLFHTKGWLHSKTRYRLHTH